MLNKMNVPGSTGESSCKRQENGDGPVEPDRPLKKARFAWQVKGKYHLKNENSDSKIVNTSKNSVPASAPSLSSKDHKNLIGNTEQNLEILGDYLLKQDFNTLDAITDRDKIVLPSTSNEKFNLPYPKYVSSIESSSSKDNRSSDEENSAVPTSLTHSNNYNEDQCIARWQARQMAKCFVDNTINHVLDNWMIAPIPAEVDNNRFLALDVAEFINNLPGDNTIENEGILMAISAHGLQNTSASNKMDGEEKQLNNNDMFNTPPSSPVISEELSLNHGNDPSSSSELDMSWSYEDESKQCDSNELKFDYYSRHSSSYKYYGEKELDSSTVNNSENTLNCDNVMDNYDFLDAAVTFAIQNKGLASFGTEYG